MIVAVTKAEKEERKKAKTIDIQLLGYDPEKWVETDLCLDNRRPTGVEGPPPTGVGLPNVDEGAGAAREELTGNSPVVGKPIVTSMDGAAPSGNQTPFGEAGIHGRRYQQLSLPPPVEGVHKYGHCQTLYEEIHDFLLHREWAPTNPEESKAWATWTWSWRSSRPLSGTLPDMNSRNGMLTCSSWMMEPSLEDWLRWGSMGINRGLRLMSKPARKRSNALWKDYLHKKSEATPRTSEPTRISFARKRTTAF